MILHKTYQKSSIFGVLFVLFVFNSQNFLNPIYTLFFMVKTFVITGGAGFIGSHFCEFLLAKGEKVICIDNFLTSTPKNINHLKPDKNFTFIEHDVNNPILIKESVNYVLHLACPPSPIDFKRIPLEIL